MENDLQTPHAVAVLSQLAQRIHAVTPERLNIENAQRILRQCGRMLGLRLDAADSEAGVR
jgi:hypothetical protein